MAHTAVTVAADVPAVKRKVAIQLHPDAVVMINVLRDLAFRSLERVGDDRDDVVCEEEVPVVVEVVLLVEGKHRDRE